MFFSNLKFWAKYYFNIDDLGKGIVSKLIFILLLASKVSIRFLPAKYTDFSELTAWFNTVLKADEVTEEMMVIPLTRENMIYLALSVFVLFFCISVSIFYSGLVIRHSRRLISGVKIISAGGYWLRFILVEVAFAFLYIPFIFAAVYLLLLFLLAIPFICNAVTSYLSGDRGMWDSIAGCSKRLKGKYLLFLRDLCGVYLVYLVIGFVISLLSYVSSTVYFIMDAALDCWFYLAFARVCAIQYTIGERFTSGRMVY